MRFKSQIHPEDDQVDRITDCSRPTLYGQAPAVCTRILGLNHAGLNLWSAHKRACVGQRVSVVYTFHHV